MPQINRQRTYPGGYTRVPNWFLRDYLPHLTFSQVQVYLTIARLERKHDSGRVAAFVSNERLAEFTGLSVRQVRRCVDRLLELGVIWQVNTPRRGTATEYEVVCKRPSVPLEADTQTPATAGHPDPLNGHEEDTGVRDTPSEADTQTPSLRTTRPEVHEDTEIPATDEDGWWVPGPEDDAREDKTNDPSCVVGVRGVSPRVSPSHNETSVVSSPSASFALTRSTQTASPVPLSEVA